MPVERIAIRGLRVDLDVERADGGERADAARVQHVTRLEHRLARGDVGRAPADVLPRIHRREDPDIVRSGDALGLLDHHDRVGALRHGGARRDLDALPRGDRRVATCAVWTVSIERRTFGS